MEARWARTARGWSVALLAGVLTATLHASAGGGFPAPAVVLLAVLLSGILSTCIVGRFPSLPRLAAAVAVGQASFHTVFTALGNSTGVALLPAEHSGHTGHGMLVESGAAHGAAAHSGMGMLLAHVAAGAISALLLAHSERALLELALLARLTFRRLLTTPAIRPLPALRRSLLDVAVPSLSSTPLLGSLRYRGPPAVLRAA
jgi:hypothetical protein